MFPVEKLILLWAAGTALLYKTLSVPMRSPAGLYSERIFQSIALYFVGLVVSLLLMRLAAIRSSNESWRETLLRFRRDYLSFKLLSRDLRLMNAISLTFVLFIELKNAVPLVTGEIWDDWFIRAEKAVFGGNLAVFWVQRIFAPSSADALSASYLLFYPFMAVVLLVAVLQRDEKFAQRFILAFGLVWLLGILAVYLVPTWGPCFAVPETIAGLPQTAVSEMQLDLWKHKVFLDQHPQSAAGVFLISGFPSLHLAVPALSALMFYRRFRWLAAASLVFTLVTVVSTLYFAWHYVLDDLGAIFLAFGAAAAASKITAGSAQKAEKQ